MDDKKSAPAKASTSAFSATQAERDNPPCKAVVQPLFEYSNEARAYHCRYSELSEAHDKGNYDSCREGCLNILTEPNVPYCTRVQILQMLSTLLAPPVAQSCIREAASMLARMDQRKLQVRLLTGDNEMMQRDLDAVQAGHVKKEDKDVADEAK